MASAAAAAGAAAANDPQQRVDRSPTPQPSAGRKRQIEERVKKAQEESRQYRNADVARLMDSTTHTFRSSAKATLAALWVVRTAKNSVMKRSQNQQLVTASANQQTYSESQAAFLARKLGQHRAEHAEVDALVMTTSKSALESSAKATLPELHLSAPLVLEALSFKATAAETRTAESDLKKVAQFLRPDDAWTQNISPRRVDVMKTVGFLHLVRNLHGATKQIKHNSAASGNRLLTNSETPEYKAAVDGLAIITFATDALRYLNELREKFAVVVNGHASMTGFNAGHVQALLDVLRRMLLGTISTAFQGAADELIKQISLPFMIAKRYERNHRSRALYSTDNLMHTDEKICTPDEIMACNEQRKIPAYVAAEYSEKEMAEFNAIRLNQEKQTNGSFSNAVALPGSGAAVVDAKIREAEMKKKKPAAAAAAAAAAEVSSHAPTRLSAIAAKEAEEEAKRPKPVMKNATKDAWVFQAFCLWFKQHVGYDFVAEHCVLWCDWSYRGRCMNRLSNGNKDPERAPYVVCLGTDHWFVQHKGVFLQFQCGVGRTMMRALALWCWIVVKELKGKCLEGHKLTMSHLWNDVSDSEEELSAVVAMAREAAKKQRERPPDLQSLFK
jgi:hypothetical protein